MTYNNYACFYKSMGKYRVALSFLQETLQFEKKKNINKNISDTFLNICAVLSKLNKHKEAFQASLNSIVLIQEELLNYCLPVVLGKASPRGNNQISSTKDLNPKLSVNQKKEIKTKTHDRLPNHQKQDSPLFHNELYERVIVLTIAYHNLAVELEHLKLYQDSLSTYQKAHNLAHNILGGKTQVVENLQKILVEAQTQLKNKLTQKTEKKTHSNNKKRIFSAINQQQARELKNKKVHTFIKESKQDLIEQTNEIYNFDDSVNKKLDYEASSEENKEEYQEDFQYKINLSNDQDKTLANKIKNVKDLFPDQNKETKKNDDYTIQIQQEFYNDSHDEKSHDVKKDEDSHSENEFQQSKISIAEP